MPQIKYAFPPDTTAGEALRSCSMAFPTDVVYEFRDGSIIIYTRKNGVLAVDSRRLRLLAYELLQIADAWEGVKT